MDKTWTLKAGSSENIYITRRTGRRHNRDRQLLQRWREPGRDYRHDVTGHAPRRDCQKKRGGLRHLHRLPKAGAERNSFFLVPNTEYILLLVVIT